MVGDRPFHIRVRQVAPRRLVLSVDGERVERPTSRPPRSSCRRMFGLDLDAERFYAEAARDDRVLRRLQSRMLGVRPVTAPTPLAALVWTLIADEHGPERARLVIGRLGGAEEAARPGPPRRAHRRRPPRASSRRPSSACASSACAA